MPCDFDISYYGEPLYGWIPRFNYIFTQPPNTYIALSLPMGIMNDISVFSLEVKPVDHTQTSFIMFSIGVALFTFADILSHSWGLYMTMWFIGGAFVSLMTILALVIYFASKTVTKGGIGMTQLALLTSVGWTSMYFIDLVPSTSDILQNRFDIDSWRQNSGSFSQKTM